MGSISDEKANLGLISKESGWRENEEGPGGESGSAGVLTMAEAAWQGLSRWITLLCFPCLTFSLKGKILLYKIYEAIFYFWALPILRHFPFGLYVKPGVEFSECQRQWFTLTDSDRLNPSHVGSPRNITTASGVGFYDQLRCTGTETEAQSGEGSCLKSHNNNDNKKWQSWDPNPGPTPRDALPPTRAWQVRQKLSGVVCNKWTHPLRHLAEWWHLINVRNGSQISCTPPREQIWTHLKR